MSVPQEPSRSLLGEPVAADAAGADIGEAEEVDGLPVLAPEPAVVRVYPGPNGLTSVRAGSGVMIPAVQAAAVAAGGFVAGAAIVGLAARHQRRSAALVSGRRAGRQPGRAARTGRGGRTAGRAGELVQIVGSRSLLLDVHLLGGRN